MSGREETTGDGRLSIRHLVFVGDSLNELRGVAEKGEGRLESLLFPQLPRPWKLSLVSQDEVLGVQGPQRLPEGVSHAVISLEGIASLEASGLLELPVASVQEALVGIGKAADAFEAHVARLVDMCLELQIPTVLCTMYPPRFPDPDRQQALFTALSVFNQRIMRRAFAARVPVVPLALVCTEPDDYFDATRLSKSGLRKAGNVILAALLAAQRRGQRTEVFF